MNMQNKAVSFYTADGLQKLKDELHELRTKGRSNAAAAIAEARDKGDLSENAEYDAAKDAQGLLEMRISKLEEIVGNARLIDESTIDISKAGLLTMVKFKDIKSGAVQAFTLVSEEEADLKLRKISIKSPIGQALVGKAIGQIAQAQTPAGVKEFEILDISLANL